jgi:biofilm PGA synthesis N-glycosyltransferase PgaC
VVTDADTHVHPQAVKLLVARLTRSPRIVAVAGSPHVTNRSNLLHAMQMLEAASIIGLIRRTQALIGRVGVVAGVLGLFRRDAVLAVGGYDGRMATEDIDLSWRLLMAGGHTAFEPRALVGMEVPSTLRALWAQRKRWARGQGEVLHDQGRTAMRWRNRRMWPIAIEGAASLVWVVFWALTLVLGTITVALGRDLPLLGLGIAWGIAVAAVASIQLSFALGIDDRYDPRLWFAFLLGPIYPLAYWALAACAAIRSQVGALFTGPRDKRVVWDIPREQAARAGPGDAP